MKISTIARASAIACALGLGFAAQAEEAAPEHSMTGCLQKGEDAGSFRLTDLGIANGPAVVEIPEATVDLGPHVGHKVEVTGSTIAGKDPAAHTMKITAMKHLAATCP